MNEIIGTPSQLASLLVERTMYGHTKRELAQLISVRGWWADVMDMAAQGGNSGPGARLSFRAGWCLEGAYFIDRRGFAPYAARFAQDFMTVRNRSVHRHYSKMLFDMLRRGILVPDAMLTEELAGRCFDLLIDPGTKVAVRVWLAEVLVLLAGQVGWIGEHLRPVLERQAAEGSPAMRAHVRKMFSRLP